MRYLLGERTLEENLFRIKAKLSDDLDAAQSQAQSSSDEDDDDLQAQAMDMSQGALADFNTQYNVPLPKACGALWANDGRLVCFFPHKEEKVQPLFDAYSWKASERSTRSRKAFFEGFGHLNKRPEHSSLRRSMVAPTDSDSDGSEYSYSSSESTSSSQDTNTAYQLFLPSMGLREVNLETYTGIATGESQWSSGDPEQGKNVSSSLNYVSLHDCQDFLPSRKDLARKYIRSRDQHYSCIQNARVAREADLHDIADIWNLVGLLVRRQVPMEIAMDSRQAGSIVATARRAMHPLRSKDSAIDLSSDTKDDAADAPRFESTGWGQHPFGQQWLVEEL